MRDREGERGRIVVQTAELILHCRYSGHKSDWPILIEFFFWVSVTLTSYLFSFGLDLKVEPETVKYINEHSFGIREVSSQLETKFYLGQKLYRIILSMNDNVKFNGR